MAHGSKFAALGAVSMLIVAAFVAGWALSPAGMPSVSSAGAISTDSNSTGTADTSGAQQDPRDEMTQLCLSHMTEMGTQMEEMMGEMMPGMMGR